MSSSWIREQFPLHFLVWNNGYQELETLLNAKQHDIESVDPRGRTPIHLAIALGHLESVRVLLRHGASANKENNNFWTAVQEAISTSDPEIVQLCLQYRDFQRFTQRSHGVPALLQRLTESPDFYVEMKWEFTSWVPLVSRICPSDTYKVWKCGSNVRIDTTLLGFDNMNWQRGNRSYVFKGQADVASVMEIDHDARQVFTETIRVLSAAPDIALLKPSEEAVAARLTSPIVTTYIDTEKIAFERSKSGLWGWRSDKAEAISGYTCKVFSASNVHLVTKTRTEHLTDQDKKRTKKSSRTPLESFLGVAEDEDKQQGVASNGELAVISHNPTSITPEEYFDVKFDLTGRDIGRPIEQTTKTQKFRAQLWLCEQYPLSLPEQLVPIIDLMAATNAHFRKLKDFITLQLPSGFPVKIEIPLFHVLNARITFGNIFASENQVPGVICLKGNEDLQCSVDEAMFEAPSTYSVIGDMHHERLRDEDDELLQFAIQQSLVESGSENDQVTLWEALNKAKPLTYSPRQEDQLLQQALAASLGLTPELTSCADTSVHPHYPPPSYGEEDEQLQLVLELSEKEEREKERQRKWEEEELERILQLSMTEK